VSWLYWLEIVVPSCLHWLQNLAFTGWIVFFWFYFHWLNRLLILLSLAGSSFDLTFTGWIVFFWSYLHWLDRLLLILSSLAGSSSDLIFTGWIIFWSYLHWLDRLVLILPSLAESFSSDLTFTGSSFDLTCIFFNFILLITIQVLWTGSLKQDMTFLHLHYT